MIKDSSGRSLWVELALKFKYFYRKVLSAIYLMFIPLPGFVWSVIDKESINPSSSTLEKLLKYEFKNRAEEIVKLEYVGGSMLLKKLLIKMGFIVDMVWGASKYADMAAVKDLDIPSLYAPIWAFINWFFISLPLPKFQLFLPGFGKRRLHIRIFEDKANNIYYVTAHVDNTNPLSLSIKDKKEMYQSHFQDKIDGDYRLGQQLFTELLENYFHKQFKNLV